MGWYWVI